MMVTTIGIDPHNTTHTAVAIDESETVLGELTVPADRYQTKKLMGWASGLNGGGGRLWAVESAGGLGYLLSQQLVADGDTSSTCPRCWRLGFVKTLVETPSDATHWSTRSMAKEVAMSQTAISRIWQAFGLKPHLVEDFKLSPDPQFIDKVRDIVGLYLNPPQAAVVLCVDEKTQVQALDRTAPILPLIPGVPQRRTHDYQRNGTTNLYAARDVASGHVITDMTPRHRAIEFRKFLNLINCNVPDHLDVYIVIDNVSTHKTPEIQRWL